MNIDEANLSDYVGQPVFPSEKMSSHNASGKWRKVWLGPMGGSTLETVSRPQVRARAAPLEVSTGTSET